MPDQVHIALLKQGIDVWNHWRGAHPDIFPVLRETDLRGANLTETNLQGVDFRGANLCGVDFGEAILNGVIFD